MRTPAAISPVSRSCRNVWYESARDRRVLEVVEAQVLDPFSNAEVPQIIEPSRYPLFPSIDRSWTTKGREGAVLVKHAVGLVNNPDSTVTGLAVRKRGDERAESAPAGPEDLLGGPERYAADEQDVRRAVAAIARRDEGLPAAGGPRPCRPPHARVEPPDEFGLRGLGRGAWFRCRGSG